MGPHESMGAIPLDLETATADDLWRSGPDFVRLAGLGDAVLETATDAALEVNAALAEGATLTGHNVTGFDLPALARHQGLPLAMLRGRVLDTDLIARLADPPPSGKDGVAKRPKGYYGLDAVCERAGLPGKTDDLPALAKEFGGYDQIPPSDERYRSYLVGDLEASRALTQRWLEQGVIDDYARRESDIGLITGQMSLNGFRVDTPEVDRTLAAQAQRRGANLALLASRYGLPLTDAKGEAHAAPLATKAGKTAMEAALRRYGVPEAQIPRTPKSGDLQLSGDAAGALAERYPQLAEWARAVAEVTGERSVYQTAKTYTVTDPDGVDRVHPSIRPYQATGRWSVTRPGLTVLGKRQGRHVERRIFLPEDGQVVIAVDLDQVDARAVAGHSGDAAYMAIFQDPDRDLWTEVALSVFGDAAHRDNAKAVGHGWNYGESINGLVRGGVSEEVARRFDAGMRRQYPQLVEWQRHVRSLGSAGELLDNGFGRKLRCDPRFAHTQAPALVGQATTRDLLAEGLLRLPVEIWPMLRVIVHDELVLSVPEKDWQDIAGVVQEAFRQDFRGVPITAGVSRPGRTWAQVYGD